VTSYLDGHLLELLAEKEAKQKNDRKNVQHHMEQADKYAQSVMLLDSEIDEIRRALKVLGIPST
tara:strand:- start:28 stop:219 length:192 start_codon:yes stop_codon:yes gene_type:complete